MLFRSMRMAMTLHLAEAYIMKKVAEDGNEELVCEFVEDEQELDAISKVFAELLEDVSIEMQE